MVVRTTERGGSMQNSSEEFRPVGAASSSFAGKDPSIAKIQLM